MVLSLWNKKILRQNKFYLRRGKKIRFIFLEDKILAKMRNELKLLKMKTFKINMIYGVNSLWQMMSLIISKLLFCWINYFWVKLKQKSVDVLIFIFFIINMHINIFIPYQHIKMYKNIKMYENIEIYENIKLKIIELFIFCLVHYEI